MGTEALANPSPWEAVPFHFWSVMFFMFGAVIGSFLNVCIYRMPLGISIVTPPSHCPHCKYAIPFYLNVPLLTWLALHGRCKNCGAPFSFRYFLVELLTGLMFLGIWTKFGDPGHPLPSIPLAFVYCIFAAGLIVATFIDFEHFIIPDEITLGGAALGFAVSFFLPSLQGASSVGSALGRCALGIVVGAGVVYAILRAGKLMFGRHRIQLEPGAKVIFTDDFLILGDKEIAWGEIFYRKTDRIELAGRRIELVDRGYPAANIRLSPAALEINGETLKPEDVKWLEAECDEIVIPREAMGLGDVKFMAAIGAFIGWQGALFSLMASSLIGAVVGVTLIAIRRREWSSRMPYGPYIALAAVLWLFAGPRILAHFFPAA